MKLDFDIQNVKLTEFGVGRDGINGQTFVAVPVDAAVQTALREMIRATCDAMRKNEDGPAKYEPSEKYSATEYLFLSIRDDLASTIKNLHEAAQLDIQTSALNDSADVFCYFSRLTDNKNRRLTAIRRATQFKGVLKSKGRLIRWLDDSLRIIDEIVFKLDNDFDLLVDAVKVHILRPSGFEFAGKLQQAILEAVPENIKMIRKDIAFIDFAGIEEYACKHPRAARYLSSIRILEGMKNIDKTALKKLCKNTGVKIIEIKGKLAVAPGHEMGLLEVLDRRRYELRLIPGQPERFKAASRRKI